MELLFYIGTLDLKKIYPRLAPYAISVDTSFNQAFLRESLLDNFHLPLSIVAYDEFHDFNDQISNATDIDEHDLWNYPWGNSFSVSKAYAFFMDVKHPTQPPSALRCLSKSCC